MINLKTLLAISSLVLLSNSTNLLAASNPDLKARLLQMGKLDQNARKAVQGIKGNNPKPEIVAHIAQVDNKNLQALKTIIKQYGWPDKTLVDAEGVQAAFLIVQHATDKQFQQNMLPFIEQSWRNNEGITGQEFALLTDRVLVGLGKPQRYGTQYKSITEKGVEFLPIADPKNVDKRRAEVKMPPMDFYRRLLEEMAGLKDYPDIEL